MAKIVVSVWEEIHEFAVRIDCLKSGSRYFSEFSAEFGFSLNTFEGLAGSEKSCSLSEFAGEFYVPVHHLHVASDAGTEHCEAFAIATLTVIIPHHIDVHSFQSRNVFGHVKAGV